jgi:isoleucyl-tRNA synthetase
LKVMETNGADIIRLWALSVDFTEDHRIGDEILKGVADQYRKLRNTFRYLLGALDGFDRGRAGGRCRHAGAGALCPGPLGRAAGRQPAPRGR